tara:strand:+ start:6480 stop:7142 length:663 start_codon:yes stop_codon:yes gene_type:complete
MRVGITGWRGFIGSHLKDRLEDPVLFQGDMHDLEAVKEFVWGCDKVYHLAGKNRGPDGSILVNNLASTGNLFLATILLGTSPEIIFVSSKQVEWNPRSEYGMTKRIEERIVRSAAKWTIFRVPNVYGPGGKPFYNSVVATFSYQIAHGIPLTADTPYATREFVFLDDLVDILATPVDLYRIVNVEGEVMSVQEVHDYLTSRLGEHEKLKRCLDYYSNLVK